METSASRPGGALDRAERVQERAGELLEVVRLDPVPGVPVPELLEERHQIRRLVQLPHDELERADQLEMLGAHVVGDHRAYRRRSLEQVLEEIELRYRQGYRVIDFEDDNLTN